MVQNCPIFVDDRKESVHLICDFFAVRREMIADIDRLFPESSAKLRSIRNRRAMQRPQRVLIEEFNALLQTNLYAVG